MAYTHISGWAKYSLDGASLNKAYVSETKNSITLNYPCSSYSSCFPYVVDLEPGLYHIEMYGASGGRGFSLEGGTGGYSSGCLSISSKTKYYVFIGGQGSTVSGSALIQSPGGFNGGGNGETGSLQVEAGSGGGATDIRIGSKLLSNRLIVAGGGGGTSKFGKQGDMIGGQGGGENGGIGVNGQPSLTAGEGGTQTAPGKCQYSDGNPGIENVGGNGRGLYASGGGGGGGYFGGGGGYYASGGGGSGFVSNLLAQNPKFPSKTTSSTRIGNGVFTITLLERFLKYSKQGQFAFSKYSKSISLALLVFSRKQ